MIDHVLSDGGMEIALSHVSNSRYGGHAIVIKDTHYGGFVLVNTTDSKAYRFDNMKSLQEYIVTLGSTSFMRLPIERLRS